MSNALHPEHLHDLIPKVVDDFHCDAPRLRLVEGAGGVAVQSRPGIRVDLGLEGGLQGFVGIVEAVGKP